MHRNAGVLFLAAAVVLFFAACADTAPEQPVSAPILVEMEGWPMEEFSVSKEEGPARKRFSLRISGTTEKSLKCFVQVETKGFRVGERPDQMAQTYISDPFLLAGVPTGGDPATLDVMIEPAGTGPYPYRHDAEVFIDVKVAAFDSGDTFFHRRCYYYCALEGDGNLHLYRPVEIDPSRDEKYRNCECAPALTE